MTDAAQYAIELVIDLFILFIPTTLLILFIFITLQEIIIVSRNYNFIRAKDCSYNCCGLYYYDPKNPLFKDCRNPKVDKSMFRKLSTDPKEKSCYWSVAVIEADGNRRPAGDYETEYLARVSAFPRTFWWQVIVVFFGVATLFLSSDKIITLISKILVDK